MLAVRNQFKAIVGREAHPEEGSGQRVNDLGLGLGLHIRDRKDWKKHSFAESEIVAHSCWVHSLSNGLLGNSLLGPKGLL